MLIEWWEARERQSADLYRAAAGELRVRFASSDMTVVALLAVAEIVEATDDGADAARG